MQRQNKLVLKVLETFHKVGVLDKILLIGSWCLYFYKDYFKGTNYRPIIKTRDIDFVVPINPKFPKKVDIKELFSPLGFDVSFFGKGYMKLENEELILEFLISEVGRPSEKPHIS